MRRMDKAHKQTARRAAWCVTAISFAWETAKIVLDNLGRLDMAGTLITHLYALITSQWTPVSLFIGGVLTLMWLHFQTTDTKQESPQATEEDFKVLREVRECAARAAVLNDRGARAKELITDLEAMWHHWNNAGETLVHPLTTNCDPMKNAESSGKLISEALRFKLRYADHLSVLTADFPDFYSNTVHAGYPCSREYVAVLSDLKEHAAQLEQEASQLWDKC